MSGNTHTPHIIPLSVYLGVTAILFVGTIITVLVANYDFGVWNIAIAMIIACTKGTFVALYFMHLKYDNKLFGIILILSLLFLTIFIGFTMIDTMFRGEIEPLEKSPIQTESEMYKK